ncbi:MAG: hypothetical protein JXA20_12115 [Spirochaetes bacterium]|nr:hypothetical protein [Spirochaetota bacterium]
MQTSSGRELAEIIKKAIDDHQVTHSEYEEILHIANKDGVIDSQEAALLRELNHLIENKTVKRVAG